MLWNAARIQAEIQVTVNRGYGFVASVEGSLEGIPLAFWQYGREQMSFSWRRRSCQYLLGPCLGVHAKQSLSDVSFAYSDSLASGWKALPLSRISSSDDKALVCELDKTGDRFSLNCRRKAGSLVVKAVETEGAVHELPVKVLPESLEDKWQGVWESPRFRSRTNLRWRWWMRFFGCSVCVIFLVVWLWGCWQSQVIKLGLGPGTWYTLGQFGLALLLVLALTTVAFMFNALMFGLSRKLKR